MDPTIQFGLLLVAALLLSSGCHHDVEDKKPQSTAPTVQVVTPTLQTIDCNVQQPGFVNAYEQTSLFSKVSGFIKSFNVDIGQEVQTGQVLAEIFVPELNDQHQQMVEQVKLDEQMVAQAQQLVEVAQSNVENAKAQLGEAQANVGKYEAEVIRWESEVRRLTRMVAQNVVDKDILTETQKDVESAQAAVNAAHSAVGARQADVVSAQANLGKAKIDVGTAKAKVKVTEAEEHRTAALVAYTQITAPYDGVVTVRNANTGDYVQAVTGDKSSITPSAMFVVEHIDPLRIFLDVPERYAVYVQRGQTKATVRAVALSGMEIPATVTRTSWAIRERSRTLWTEIDLTKQQYDGLRPGMFVYVTILIHRPDVLALPAKSLVMSGNQTYCYRFRDGKAIKTPIDTAISDDKMTEVTKMKINGDWVQVTGNEQVIVGDVSGLTDGEKVEVAAK